MHARFANHLVAADPHDVLGSDDPRTFSPLLRTYPGTDID